MDDSFRLEVAFAGPIRQTEDTRSLESALTVTAERKSKANNDSCHKAESGTCVLVVEDNLVNRQVVVRMLEQLGCTVDVVENGALAVAATRGGNYDLVLMDCLMPVMDGWKAARAIRKIPGPSQQARIVAMTACGLQEDRRRCMDAGMDDYMLKPLDITAVQKQVEKLS